MFTRKDGGCNCHFCANGQPHPHDSRPLHNQWSEAGHLQVAESLDPKDILRTRVCKLCAHEEVTR